MLHSRLRERKKQPTRLASKFLEVSVHFEKKCFLSQSGERFDPAPPSAPFSSLLARLPNGKACPLRPRWTHCCCWLPNGFRTALTVAMRSRRSAGTERTAALNVPSTCWSLCGRPVRHRQRGKAYNQAGTLFRPPAHSRWYVSAYGFVRFSWFRRYFVRYLPAYGYLISPACGCPAKGGNGGSAQLSCIVLLSRLLDRGVDGDDETPRMGRCQCPDLGFVPFYNCLCLLSCFMC